MDKIPGKIMCDCGHVESYHSHMTRGYGIDQNGKTSCYKCCLNVDIKELKETGKVTAYISSDGKHITTWPGMILANITGKHTVNFGYCRDQISFDAIMPDGTRVYGRGPGAGMYCRVRVKKKQK